MWDKITALKNKILDPNSQLLVKRNIIALLLVGIGVLSIPLGVDLVNQQQTLRSRASSDDAIYRVSSDREGSYKTLSQMRTELQAAGWPGQDINRPAKELFYLYTRNGPARTMRCAVNKGDLSNMPSQIQSINVGDRVVITVVQKWEDEPSKTWPDGKVDHYQWNCNEWYPNVKFINNTTGHSFDNLCSGPVNGRGWENKTYEGHFNQERPDEQHPELYSTFAPLEQVKSCTATVPEAGDYTVEIFYTDRSDRLDQQADRATNPGCNTNGKVKSFCGFQTGVGSGGTGTGTGTGGTGTGGGTGGGAGVTPTPGVITTLPPAQQPTTLPAPTGLIASCSTDNSRVNIAWNQVDGVKGYRVRLDKNPGNSPFLKPEGGVGDGDFLNEQVASNSIDLNITPSSPYKFWMHAYNDNVANGPVSENINFTCPGGVGTTPGDPSSLRVSSVCDANNKIRLGWKAGTAATSYVVKVDGVTVPNVVIPSNLSARPYVVFSAQRGRAYSWSVQSINSSAQSSIVSGNSFSCNI